MGISSSKSTTKPIYNKEIEGTASTLTGAYNAAAPGIAETSRQITGLLPSMIDRFSQGDPALNAARGYITSTLDGDPAQNPHLDDIIGRMGRDTSNSLHATMGTRGLTGGTAMQDILSRNLSQQAGDMRYNDWNAGQQRRAQAAGMAPGVAGAQSDLIAPILAASDAGMMPIRAASGYAGGMGGLLGQYTQTKTSNPWGPAVGQMLSSAAVGFSDVRLKEGIRLIGETHGGVPLYSFRYKGDTEVKIGPMAHEVAEVQPAALGPDIGGFATVRYGDLR